MSNKNKPSLREMMPGPVGHFVGVTSIACLVLLGLTWLDYLPDQRFWRVIPYALMFVSHTVMVYYIYRHKKNSTPINDH